MTDLVEFIEARLRDDQAAALAASGEWSVDHWPHDVTDDDNECRAGTCDCRVISSGSLTLIYDEGGHTAADARHIARHDPARVLREVEAKRRLIADHAIPADRWPDDSYHQQRRDVDQSCTGCGANYREEPMVEDINDCPVLRAVAAVWSDHPNYRTEWAPS